MSRGHHTRSDSLMQAPKVSPVPSSGRLGFGVTRGPRLALL
jgi:hypothetical protein